MEQAQFYSETGLSALKHPDQFRQWLISNTHYRLKLNILDYQCVLDDCLKALKHKPEPKPKSATRVIELAAA